MEPFPLVPIVLRWWWLLLLAAALGSMGGYVLSLRTPPIYRASTTLIVALERPARGENPLADERQRVALTKTYQALLLKRPVLEGVIQQLGLQVTSDELREQLAVSEVRDTLLVELTVEDRSPEQAASIANALVLSFNRRVDALLANRQVANRVILHVVEVAVPPREAHGAGALRNGILGALIGLLLGGGSAFVAELCNTRVRTRRDVERLCGTTVVAEVTRLSGWRPRRRLLTAHNPTSAKAEVYRMMRVYVEERQPPLHSLLITSARAWEGKTTTAANLAIALAQTGVRVVLIDANLRRPQLHELFECPNTVGLVTALQHNTLGTLYEYSRATSVANLRLLPSGQLSNDTAAHIAQLLTPQRVQGVIEQLVQHADLVIFDSPPLLDALETSLMARACDALLLVVQANHTRLAALARAHELLAHTQVVVLGVVLNRVKRTPPDQPSGYGVRRRRVAVQPLPQHDADAGLPSQISTTPTTRAQHDLLEQTIRHSPTQRAGTEY